MTCEEGNLTLDDFQKQLGIQFIDIRQENPNIVKNQATSDDRDIVEMGEQRDEIGWLLALKSTFPAPSAVMAVVKRLDHLPYQFSSKVHTHHLVDSGNETSMEDDERI